MATATLTFDLSKEEDMYAYEVASNGAAYRCVISEFDQWLKSQVKHCPEDKLPDAIKIREMLWHFIRENEITL